jgi:glutaredoxin
MIRLLQRLLSARPAPIPSRVVVYSRNHCHCCQVALETLKKAARKHPLLIETVDIDGDPDLKAQFDRQVPVVAINGRIRFRGKVNAVLLDRLLRSESQASCRQARLAQGQRISRRGQSASASNSPATTRSSRL